METYVETYEVPYVKPYVETYVEIYLKLCKLCAEVARSHQLLLHSKQANPWIGNTTTATVARAKDTR